MEVLRDKYEELDKQMMEYEKYIEKNGLPYCDYKLHRNNKNGVKPIVKLRNGIKRIIRIMKSYKSSAFTDILSSVQEHVQEERIEKEKNKLKKVMNAKPQNHEERVEQMLAILTQQVGDLAATVTRLEAEQK